MINPEVLLTDLKRLLGQLEGDLRERADEVPALRESLRSAYERAKQAERTAQPFETWREEYLTQVAAAWILACVFVRFIEDNGLIDTPLLAGSGPRLDQAKDQRTLYFQQHPTDSDREYLYYVFRKVEALPAAAPLFDERHNPLWTFGVSGDGATLLIEFWQRIDPATGTLAHDFADPALNTRFLGDLYQDLSEAARKKYALLQTPDFVEEFILDRTLTPAIEEFGLAEVRLIDPACGSGHFLLGAFHRLLHEWQKREPAVNVRELAQRSLEAVYGVDLNPYAVAIARFRLLIAALKAAEIRRLADAPAFHTNLATGDSLLHGPKPGGERQMYLHAETDPLRHVYETEDADELRRILGASYHVVVGNPPYVTPKDAALNSAYRERFGSCHRQYSLAVPFIERFFDLSAGLTFHGEGAGGYVGTITTNSFAKKEFGRKLVERYLPAVDLTHIIDTSRAHIPGHGTSTMILFGRSRPPVAQTVRAVLGIRGEAPRPTDPSRGKVWLSILSMVDRPGGEDEYVTVQDLERQMLSKHPWALGGGGANELKALMDSRGRPLIETVDHIGYTGQTNADDAMVGLAADFLRARCEPILLRELVVGEAVRDFRFTKLMSAYVPYVGDSLVKLEDFPGWFRHLWPLRTTLWSRATFSKKTYREEGRPWWEWHLIRLQRLNDPLSLAFANVATHNHFAFSRTSRVFNSHAPVIKLSPGSEPSAYLRLLTLVASSCCCFWMKQVCSDKGVGGIGGGIGDEPWEPRYEYDAAKLERLPVPLNEIPTSLGSTLDSLAQQYAETLPSATAPVHSLDRAKTDALRLRRMMISTQEELDWRMYAVYGLLDEDLSYQSTVIPEVEFGQRAFEFIMARKVADSELQTSWFERHKAVPNSDIPSQWPEEYRRLVERRMELIEEDRYIGLLERPEFKRRWNIEAWEQQRERALREWLFARLEDPELWKQHVLVSVSQLVDRVRRDAEFMRVAESYRGRVDFDLSSLVADLVDASSVPFLPVLRYRPSGVRKRTAWEQVWDLQRREDAGEKVEPISAPPEFGPADYLASTFWRLRGKLDTPKERFISYPHCQREADQSVVIAWAGWNHLQQAQALAAYYVRMKEQEGWAPERLKPLLAGLIELIPWLKQWHNLLDSTYGIGMGDYFSGFVDEEARALGFTVEDVRAWQPPARNSRRRRRASV